MCTSPASERNWDHLARIWRRYAASATVLRIKHDFRQRPLAQRLNQGWLMHRKRLVWQLFPSYLLVTLLSLLALTWHVTTTWRRFYLEQTAADLKTRALLVETRLQGRLAPGKGAEIDRICKDLGRLTGTRLTVILPSGQVLGDSE